MADFVAVLKKTVDGLSDNTPAMREKVYRKARETVSAKLAAIDPPPPQIVVDRQHKALEDAINAVEASYTEQAAPDDFESVLAGLEAKPAAEPAKPAAEPTKAPEPMFTKIEPAAGVGPAGLAPLAAGVHSRPAAPSPHAGNWDAEATDESLTPIAPVPRPEPALARPLAGDRLPDTEDTGRGPHDNNRRRVSGGLIAAVLALLVVAAAGYGIWLNRAAFGEMIGVGGDNVVADAPADAEAEAPAAESADAEEPAGQQIAAAPAEQAGEAAVPAVQPAEEEVVKFTQRLMADGAEVDEGPAGGETSVGEGTSLAAATQAGETPAEPAASATDEQPQTAAEPAAGDEAVPVGQRAIFYEERTNVAQGSADTGSTVWSLVQESPGGNLPPEPAIRAEVSIPGKDVQFRMTIRRNGDETLPASHIVEMIFLTSDTFEGGGIDSVLRIAMKSSEAAAGNPLAGIPARIADGYFLVALNDNPADQQQNLQLLARQSWFDIPIVYRSGRRALVTMEKGVPGERIFQEAMQAWQNASSG